MVPCVALTGVELGLFDLVTINPRLAASQLNGPARFDADGIGFATGGSAQPDENCAESGIQLE